MKEFLKTYKNRIIIGVIIIFIFIPVMIYLVAAVENPFGLGFIKKGDTGVWLGYYGSIIGGSITLVGIWYTINYQTSVRKEDKIIDALPYLVIATASFSSDNSNNINLCLLIENHGVGPAVNIRLDHESHFSNGFKGKNSNSLKIIDTKDKDAKLFINSIIGRDKSFTYTLKLNTENSNFNDFIYLKIYLIYKDIYCNEYTSSILIKLDIKKSEDGEFIIKNTYETLVCEQKTPHSN